MLRSRKTTLAGALAGLGLLISFGSKLLEDPAGAAASLQEGETLGTLIAALGAVATGFYARDADVTSEGTRAEPLYGRRRPPA